MDTAAIPIQHGALLDHDDHAGHSALRGAAVTGEVACVKLLVAAGEDQGESLEVKSVATTAMARVRGEPETRGAIETAQLGYDQADAAEKSHGCWV